MVVKRVFASKKIHRRQKYEYKSTILIFLAKLVVIKENKSVAN